jgi:hypothetical protein
MTFRGLFSPAFNSSLTTNHLSIIASTICNFLAATKSPQLFGRKGEKCWLEVLNYLG